MIAVSYRKRGNYLRQKDREGRRIPPSPPIKPASEHAGDNLQRRWIWLLVLACAVALVVGIGIGSGRDKHESSEPRESVQMQGSEGRTTAPIETTEQMGMTENTTIGDKRVINSSVDKTVEVMTRNNEYIGVKEFAWFINSNYLSCVITIVNNSDEYVVEFPSFRITAYDTSGVVLGSYEQVLSIIYPEHDFTAYCLMFELSKKPDKIDIVLLEPEDYCIVHKSLVKHEKFEKLVGNNVVVYGDSVKGEIINPNNYGIEGAMVTAVFRDKNGDIVFGEQTFVNQLPAAGSVPFDMYVFSADDLDLLCEISASPW